MPECGVGAGTALIAQRLRDCRQLELRRDGRVIPTGHGQIIGDEAAGGASGSDDPSRLLVAHRGDRVGRRCRSQQGCRYLLGQREPSSEVQAHPSQ